MFKDLSRFEITRESVAELHMRELGPKAVLKLRPATDANQLYHTNFMKLTAKVRKDISRGAAVDAEILETLRNIQRQLFPLFVLAGWEGVEGDPDADGIVELDENGMVPFSREAAKELCRLLPDPLFDKIVLAAGAPENFYGEEEIVPPSPEELDDLAGN
jgi:hypothetical protein